VDEEKTESTEAQTEGKLGLEVSCGAGVVKLDFGRPIRWIALPPDQAFALSVILAQHAGTAQAALEEKTPTIVGPDGKPS